MPIYSGTVNVRLHDTKGVTVTRGNKEATATAADVEQILNVAIEAAAANNTGLCRYCFYIPGVNEKLARDAKQIPLAKVKAAIKEGLKPLLLTQKKYPTNPQVVISNFSTKLDSTAAVKKSETVLL